MKGKGAASLPPRPGLLLVFLRHRLAESQRVALLGAGLREVVVTGREARFLEADRDVMAPIVAALPRCADVFAVCEHGVIRVAVLLLVVVALEGEACLDGEGVELAGEAGFGGGEAADDECAFLHSLSPFRCMKPPY